MRGKSANCAFGLFDKLLDRYLRRLAIQSTDFIAMFFLPLRDLTDDALQILLRVPRSPVEFRAAWPRARH